MRFIGWAVWLTGSHLQRLLREGMIRRALGFPVVLVGLVLFMTLLVAGVFRGPSVVAVQGSLDPAAEAALREAGLTTLIVADARAAVQARDAVFGVTSAEWLSAGGRDGTVAEAALRRARGSPWWPEPPPLPDAAFGRAQGRRMAMLVLAIYALYGVVFGAAMVARDRDQGTLEVELSLPVPGWTHGASRWLAASLVLGSWMMLSVAAFVAWIGVEDPGAVGRIGLAAATGAVALGLGSVGRAGLKVGFAASLAASLTAASALFGVGYAVPAIGVHLPLASIIAGGDGWTPLAASAALGAAAVALFALRTARP